MMTFSVFQLTFLTTLSRERGYICQVCRTCWIVAQDIIRPVLGAHSAREPTHPLAQGIWIARWGAHKPVWAWTTHFPHPQQCSHPAHHSEKVRVQIELEKALSFLWKHMFAHVEKNNIVWRIKSASVFLGRFKDRFLLLYLFMKWKVQMTYYIYILLLKILNCHDLA